jgi:hypothetical protein
VPWWPSKIEVSRQASPNTKDPKDQIALLELKILRKIKKKGSP